MTQLSLYRSGLSKTIHALEQISPLELSTEIFHVGGSDGSINYLYLGGYSKFCHKICNGLAPDGILSSK